LQPKIVITNRVHSEIVDMLSAHALVVANDGEECWPDERLSAEMTDATAMMAFMPDRIEEAVLDRAPHLRLIACALKGFDNFDVDACTKRGVFVSIVKDLLTEPTAELAIGLMIGLARHVLPGDAQVRSDFKGWRSRFFGTGLKGSQVGILGMGAIGRAIAQRLAGFGRI
jgi:phosphonate dehydrogenase